MVLAGGFIASAAWVLLFLALGALVFSPVAGLGLPFLAVMTWFVRPLAALERRRAAPTPPAAAACGAFSSGSRPSTAA